MRTFLRLRLAPLVIALIAFSVSCSVFSGIEWRVRAPGHPTVDCLTQVVHQVAPEAKIVVYAISPTYQLTRAGCIEERRPPGLSFSVPSLAGVFSLYGLDDPMEFHLGYGRDSVRATDVAQSRPLLASIYQEISRTCIQLPGFEDVRETCLNADCGAPIVPTKTIEIDPKTSPLIPNLVLGRP